MVDLVDSTTLALYFGVLSDKGIFVDFIGFSIIYY